MRKPLFAVDVTEDRKKETLNAEDFIAKTNAETTVETVEDRSEALEKEIKAFRPPLYLTVIKWAALLAGVILFGVLTRDEAAANNPFGERPIITFFILLSINGHLGFFYVLVIGINAEMYRECSYLFGILISFPLGIYLENKVI